MTQKIGSNTSSIEFTVIRVTMLPDDCECISITSNSSTANVHNIKASLSFHNKKNTKLTICIITPNVFTTAKTPLSHWKGTKYALLKKYHLKIKICQNFNTTELLSTLQISGKQQTFYLFYDEIFSENRTENDQIWK